MGNPGRFFAIADTAFSAMGFSISTNTSVCRFLFYPNTWPGISLGIQAHKTRDCVDCRDPISSSVLRSSGYCHNIGHIGSQLGEYGDLADFLHPLADVLDHIRILSTCQAHTSLPHTVRTGEIQLQAIWIGCLRHECQLLPVLLAVGAHDARD